jgi:hypothetical protein
MNRFNEGEARTQVILLPDCLDDYVAEENLVRVVDVFVDEHDLGAFVGHDRGQLSNMTNQAREEMGAGSLTVVAVRGYYKGLEVLTYEQAGMHYLP